MQWFKRLNASDAYLSDTVYPGLGTSEAEGIDLRQEMNLILYGNPWRKPLGHWVVWRHFDRTRRSDYYNPYSKEGVNGPAHPFTDTLIRTRRMPYPRSDTEDSLKMGSLFDDKFVYWVEYHVPIKNGDQIYELDVTDHKDMPTSYNFTEKYDIKRIHPYRLENGNIQYYSALVELNNITY